MTIYKENSDIQIAIQNDAIDIAKIHKEFIYLGFLSSLPLNFLKILYSFIIQNEIVFVSKKGNTITGFISCSENKKMLYKRFILKNFYRVTPTLTKQLFSIRFLRGILNNFTSVFKTRTNAEKNITELLSIVVKKEGAGKGTGSLLLKKLEEELRKRQYNKYQVIAGNKLVSANNFYKKHGFQLVKKIQVHKGEDSNLYIKTLK